MKLFTKKNEDDDNKIKVAGLEDVCRWWIETYPEDIFVAEPKIIVQIRELMEKILEKRPKK